MAFQIIIFDEDENKDNEDFEIDFNQLTALGRRTLITLKSILCQKTLKAHELFSIT